MANNYEKLKMLADVYSTGISALKMVEGELREVDWLKITGIKISEVDESDLTFTFAGIRILVKIAIEYCGDSNRTKNLYNGFLEWYVLTNEKEKKLSELRAKDQFSEVPNLSDQKIVVLFDPEEVKREQCPIDLINHNFISKTIRNSIYKCLPDSLKEIEK